MKKITVNIKKNGELDVEVIGVKGKTCKDITAFIEKLGKIESSQKTVDYYKSENDPRLRHKNE